MSNTSFFSGKTNGKSSFLALAITLSAFSAGAAQAGDLSDMAAWCTKATAPSSIVICSDPELRGMAVIRTKILGDARARFSPEDMQELQDDQNQWIHEYTAACGISIDGPSVSLPVSQDVIDCYKRAGRERIAELVRDLRDLVPDYQAPAISGSTSATAAAAAAPIADANTTFKVVDIASNDVLTIREGATSQSRVIGMIPPNGTGITYEGQYEDDGRWLLIRYGDTKGWAASRYLQRAASIPGPAVSPAAAPGPELAVPLTALDHTVSSSTVPTGPRNQDPANASRPPQTEQAEAPKASASTTAAITLSRGPRAADFRIRDVSLGMPIDDIKEKLGPGFTVKDIQLSNLPIHVYLMYKGDEIYFVSTLDNKAVAIGYDTQYQRDTSPNLDEFVAALTQKYGEIVFHSRLPMEDSSDLTASWVYDKQDRLVDLRSGKASESTIGYLCSVLEGITPVILPKKLTNWNDAIYVPVSWRNECGKSIWVRVIPASNPKMVERYSAMMWDEAPVAAYLHQKTKDEAERAKANKPPL